MRLYNQTNGIQTRDKGNNKTKNANGIIFPQNDNILPFMSAKIVQTEKRTKRTRLLFSYNNNTTSKRYNHLVSIFAFFYA